METRPGLCTTAPGSQIPGERTRGGHGVGPPTPVSEGCVDRANPVADDRSVTLSSTGQGGAGRPKTPTCRLRRRLRTALHHREQRVKVDGVGQVALSMTPLRL